MANPILHQIVSGFRKGDAISDEAMLLQALCAAHGYEAPLYCARSTTAVEQRSLVRELDSLAGVVKPEDIVLLHLSIGSPGNSLFSTLKCRKAILYHNVTPSHFFERLNPPMAKILDDGRRQVASLANAAEINLADSAYNAHELHEAGYRNVSVLPLVVDASFGAGVIDPVMKARLTNDGKINLIFVGRVVPNKRHDHLLQVFHHFQHYVEPNSRLIIAGSSQGQEAYKSLLLGSVHALELKNVLFTEFITSAELNACYASASAFVCLSEHEGFCAPLLEAMAWNVPVFATATAAVPETLAGAGVLFPSFDLAIIAETIGRVIQDSELKAAILKRQQQRLANYRSRDVWQSSKRFSGCERIYERNHG